MSEYQAGEAITFKYSVGQTVYYLPLKINKAKYTSFEEYFYSWQHLHEFKLISNEISEFKYCHINNYYKIDTIDGNEHTVPEGVIYDNWNDCAINFLRAHIVDCKFEIGSAEDYIKKLTENK